MWYFSQRNEQNIPPSEWGISGQQVKQLLERLKKSYGKYYQDQNISWDDVEDEELRQLALSDFEIYNRYLSKLPEDVNFFDILQAYRSGQLPYYTVKKQDFKPFDMSDAQETEDNDLLWQPKKYKSLDKEELNELLQIAIKRINKTNKKEVEEARLQIFLSTFKDPDIYNKLNISRSQLNKLLRSWTNIPASSIELERILNQTSVVTTEWTGISNSAFIAQNKIDINNIDGFFKSIQIQQNISHWYGDPGEFLRKYILRTILAIDSHIKYDQLNFSIVPVLQGDHKNARGIYISSKKLIEIKDNHYNTVSHEIGHYLDDQWAKDLVGEKFNLSYLSDSTLNVDMVFGNDEKRKQFYNIFKEFVMNISENSNIQTSYLQNRREVFARFIAFFVNWVHKKSGYGAYEDLYNDRFTENDCLRFIRILQMKSYLDTQRREQNGFKK